MSPVTYDSGRIGIDGSGDVSPGVVVSRSGACLDVRLDRPRNRNALTLQAVRRLREVLRDHQDDPAVRFVLFSGTGGAFCSGLDLEQVLGPAGDVLAGELVRLVAQMRKLPKPIVVFVNGDCRAGGMALLCGADVVSAAPLASFAMVEIRLGLVPAVLGLLVRDRMTSPTVRRYCLTGESFGVARAVATGLVDEVVDEGTETSDVRAQFEVLFGLCAPGALAATKASLLAAEDGQDFQGSIADALEISRRALVGSEGREGINAHLERRNPWWASS